VVRFRQLIGPSAECSALEALAGWRDEPARDPRRPRVALNMIASIDGRVTVDGHSAGLGGPADRELFHALRSQADAVMAGAGTVRSERYGALIRDPAVRERRLAAGLAAQPLAVIVSAELDLDPAIGLLADAESHVVILGASERSLGPSAASVEYIRTDSLADGLSELRERFGVGVLVCEGGPTLNAGLASAGVIDELFLALAPYLGGDGGRTLFAGKDDRPLVRLALRMLLVHDSELYARYVVGS
jgi:riboflavin biosynthesis pyrimidine reductase